MGIFRTQPVLTNERCRFFKTLHVLTIVKIGVGVFRIMQVLVVVIRGLGVFRTMQVLVVVVRGVGVFRTLYILCIAGALTIVATEVVPKRPENLMSLAGLAVLLLASFILSNEPEKVRLGPLNSSIILLVNTPSLHFSFLFFFFGGGGVLSLIHI